MSSLVISSPILWFKGTIEAINLVANRTDEYNLVLVGLPLHDEYYDLINEDKIIYAGYIDWINHLFKFSDLTTSKIGERRVGKECRSRWSPYH